MCSQHCTHAPGLNTYTAPSLISLALLKRPVLHDTFLPPYLKSLHPHPGPRKLHGCFRLLCNAYLFTIPYIFHLFLCALLDHCFCQTDMDLCTIYYCVPKTHTLLTLSSAEWVTQHPTLLPTENVLMHFWVLCSTTCSIWKDIHQHLSPITHWPQQFKSFFTRTLVFTMSSLWHHTPLPIQKTLLTLGSVIPLMAAPGCSVFWSLAQQQGACKECKTSGSTLSNLYQTLHLHQTSRWLMHAWKGSTALNHLCKDRQQPSAARTMHHTPRSFCSLLSLCTLLSLKKPWQLAVQQANYSPL